MTYSNASTTGDRAPRRAPPKPQGISLNGFWNDQRVRDFAAQAIVVTLVIGFCVYIIGNAQRALSEQGIKTGFGFLKESAGFAIGESPIPFSASDSFLRAYGVGILNTLKVSLASIALASILGVFLGVARLSRNLMLNRFATLYVEVFRNTPQLLQIVFWYMLATKLPGPKQAFSLGDVAFLSNRGLVLPKPGEGAGVGFAVIGLVVAVVLSVFLRRRAEGILRKTGHKTKTWPLIAILFICLPMGLWALFGTPSQVDEPSLRGFNIRGGWQLSPEFLALFLGLSLYIAAFIAEIVRAGIASVNKGQIEAATAMGIKGNDVLWRVVLPQAMKVIVPPTTAQYVSLLKNSSLGVMIGYPELFNLNNTILTASGNTVEAIIIMMTIYLSLTTSIAFVMNWYNRSVQMKER